MNYYKEIKTELINNELYKRTKDYSKNKNDLKTAIDSLDNKEPLYEKLIEVINKYIKYNKKELELFSNSYIQLWRPRLESNQRPTP